MPKNTRVVQLRKMLKARRDELTRQMQATPEPSAPSPAAATPLSASDLAAAELERTTGLATRRMQTRMLERVTAALLELDAGTYGKCRECGDDISEARLTAIPFAPRCTECEGGIERVRAATASADPRPQRAYPLAGAE